MISGRGKQSRGSQNKPFVSRATLELAAMTGALSPARLSRSALRRMARRGAFFIMIYFWQEENMHEYVAEQGAALVKAGHAWQLVALPSQDHKQNRRKTKRRKDEKNYVRAKKGPYSTGRQVQK